jgi:hypothetical protein
MTMDRYTHIAMAWIRTSEDMDARNILTTKAKAYNLFTRLCRHTRAG